MDSCASTHMTKKEHWLENKEICNTTIVAANNRKLKGTAKGTINIKVNNGKTMDNISVKEVTYVPELCCESSIG